MSTAKHLRFDRPYDQLTYKPQQELLDYLRDNGFRTHIVSGGVPTSCGYGLTGSTGSRASR